MCIDLVFRNLLKPLRLCITFIWQYILKRFSCRWSYHISHITYHKTTALPPSSQSWHFIPGSHHFISGLRLDYPLKYLIQVKRANGHSWLVPECKEIHFKICEVLEDWIYHVKFLFPFSFFKVFFIALPFT